ncbi:MAG: hypothetical protein LBI59_02870 [Candidatus Accumulibacter sp.]|nr:hypothetical protein [Accumulibacter sp.]
MADNYYDATGVLILDRVTPVIFALFGAYNLDETFPGDGQAYIARISESNDPQWDDVREGLAGLIADLGLDLPDQEDDPPVASLLPVLAAHFGCERDEELDRLIRHTDFEDAADLPTLFLLATRFDDGHQLAALVFEGCWHCSKPRLFEFGGDACFLSREVRLDRNTRQTTRLGRELRDAVRDADVERATCLIMEETVDLLSAIRDDGFHRQVLRRLTECLTACLA